jgi:hypothetical protein
MASSNSNNRKRRPRRSGMVAIEIRRTRQARRRTKRSVRNQHDTFLLVGRGRAVQVGTFGAGAATALAASRLLRYRNSRTR